MNKKYWIALLTAVMGTGCIYYYMAVVYKGDNYRIIAGAFVMLFEMAILLTAGGILSSIKRTKTIGQGILIGSAITLVIGFGVCSSV